MSSLITGRPRSQKAVGLNTPWVLGLAWDTRPVLPAAISAPPEVARPVEGATMFTVQDVIWPSTQLLPVVLANTVSAFPFTMDVEM